MNAVMGRLVCGNCKQERRFEMPEGVLLQYLCCQNCDELALSWVSGFPSREKKLQGLIAENQQVIGECLAALAEPPK